MNIKQYGNTKTKLSLTERAYDIYRDTDPLDIWEVEDEDGNCTYSIRGAIEADDLTADEVSEYIEVLADELEISENDYWDGEIDDADYYGRPLERF